MKHFNTHTFTRFGTMVMPFFKSEKRKVALLLLCLLVCFSYAINRVQVIMSFVNRDFMNAFTVRDSESFLNELLKYLGCFALATLLAVFKTYTEERFALMWRKWLTHYMLENYFSHLAFYRLTGNREIDNPDQRIVEDVRSFTTITLSIILIMFNSLIAILLFIDVLWSIDINLVFAVFAYAVFGSVCSFYLGRPLIDLNYEQLKKEADIRYKLINVRDNSESIALLEGEVREKLKARQRVKRAVENLRRIINWNRNLNFFTHGYNYIVTILPLIIVSPLYLQKKITFGDVTQATIAFGHVLGALSIIVSNFGNLSSLAAVVERLGSFVDEMKNAVKDAKSSQIQLSPAENIRFENVTILTPDRKRALISNLNLELNPGGLLITGPSGAGKSSIIRALSGIWSAGEGHIHRPSVFFLPQRPYCVIGDLRSQFTYTTRRRAIADWEIMEVISLLGLEEMLDRVGGLDAEVDWNSFLSLGERQKLSFGRLLLFKPRFACLDETTTAVDPQSEKKVYELLQQIVENYISIGYRQNLESYHSHVLEITSGGRSKMRAVVK
ncbi:ABC transporter ATP-binding protein/permease [bacterium]|nr:ABC transporter ATP-binding protein/permease [bacterium]